MGLAAVAGAVAVGSKGGGELRKAKSSPAPAQRAASPPARAASPPVRGTRAVSVSPPLGTRVIAASPKPSSKIGTKVLKPAEKVVPKPTAAAAPEAGGGSPLPLVLAAVLVAVGGAAFLAGPAAVPDTPPPAQVAIKAKLLPPAPAKVSDQCCA